MVEPWLGILIVVGVFCGLLVGVRFVQRVASPHPEIVRKLFHIGMGLFTLSLPWIFSSPWPVIGLSGATVGLFLAIRWTPFLKRHFGNVLGGVNRNSLGELYFTASVAILFALSGGDKLLYCIPLLILTLADAVAALIGVRYGSVRYQAAVDGQKSAEGSIAFFLVAFFATHVPLLLASETGRAESLLIGVILGVLVMLFEAIAWRGIDNLFIPLFGFLLLKAYLSMTLADLMTRVVLTAVLALFVYIYRKQTTLNETGLITVVIGGYLCWTLGGWKWLVAPLTLLFTYTLLSPKTEINSRRIHNVHAVLSVTSAGLIWLYLEKTLGRPEFLLPFTLSFAGHLAIIGIARLKFDYPKLKDSTLLVLCISQSWLFFFAPYAAFFGFSRQSLFESMIALGGVTVAALAFYATQPSLDNCPADGPRWWRQAGAAALGSLAALVPLYFWTI